MPWGTAPRLFRWYRRYNVGFPLPVADGCTTRLPCSPSGPTMLGRLAHIESPFLFDGPPWPCGSPASSV